MFTHWKYFPGTKSSNSEFAWTYNIFCILILFTVKTQLASNTRTGIKICWKIKIKTRRQRHRSGAFIVSFDRISHIALVFSAANFEKKLQGLINCSGVSMLTLNNQMPARSGILLNAALFIATLRLSFTRKKWLKWYNFVFHCHRNIIKYANCFSEKIKLPPQSCIRKDYTKKHYWVSLKYRKCDWHRVRHYFLLCSQKLA